MRINGLLFLLCCSFEVWSQTGSLSGRIQVLHSTEPSIAVVSLLGTSHYCETKDGSYHIEDIPYGKYQLAALHIGSKSIEQTVEISTAHTVVDLSFEENLAYQIEEITVTSDTENSLKNRYEKSLKDFTVYEGKKNETIFLQQLVANTATSNARQVFGSITGLNIWESDGAGLQLGIGGRGLSPNRTSNFNTRQNGYDISADALGYPESYYTPPSDALAEIEIIRGAASLQYGSQFGGMVNFKFLAPAEKKIQYNGKQSIGSWEFFHSFHRLSGTSRDQKWQYSAFYQFKRGNGWRDNSGFSAHNGMLQWQRKWSDKTTWQAEYTFAQYLAQQAGGLTDALFAQNARQSVRSRNWFQVHWHLFSSTFTHAFSDQTQLQAIGFGLLARRQALGNLERINVADFNQNRTLINGKFKNMGAEFRFKHRYYLGTQIQSLVCGARVYNGFTTAGQGESNNLSGPTFSYLNPTNLEGSDYSFPNANYAVFVEHIFNLTDRWSVTPGIRAEQIRTQAEGYFRQRVFDFAGNIVVDNRRDESLLRQRGFVIAGVGTSFDLRPSMELYGNISQNYRAINFTDIRIQNPNFVIDTALADERGFTADLGIRGQVGNKIQYELTAFYLYYGNRIGQLLKADQAPLFLDYRLRTNIAASRNVGIESFVSYHLAKVLSLPKEWIWTVFVNGSWINARYFKSQDSSIEGKQVEMVPPIILRTGTTFKFKKWAASYQFNYVSKHYSDATNAIRTSTAVEGLIPTYNVSDVSAAFTINDHFKVEASCNNVFNQQYFTRRAEGYPGPGIIPSDGRSVFLTIGMTF